MAGNVGSNVEEMWTLYTQGVTYSSEKETDAVGKLQVPLGQVNTKTLFRLELLVKFDLSEELALLTEVDVFLHFKYLVGYPLKE